ncbi:MAG: proline dehydrogenase family protein [Candidatus Eisenbacteria bacterium]
MSLFDRAVVAALPWVPRPLVRRFADPYIAGETLGDAMRTVADLDRKGIRTTLDLLGEHIERIEQADAPRDGYLVALGEIHRTGLPATISVKLTQLGLYLDPEACYRNIRALVAEGKTLGVGVAIDMEESAVTVRTLEIYRRLRSEFDNVSTVLQAMLRRTVDDAVALGDLSPSIRVCKGIYVEPREIAYQEAEEVRSSYIRTAEAILDGGGFVAFATHDDVLVERCKELIQRRSLDASRFEFQMLLGVREELRDKTVAEGYPLRVYVPFGQEWYAYSVRRMRENPRVAGMVARAVLGLE